MLFLPSAAARQGIPGYSGLAVNQRLVRSQLARSSASSRRRRPAVAETPVPKHPVLSLGAKGLQAVRKLLKGLAELWVDLPEGRNIIIAFLMYQRFKGTIAPLLRAYPLLWAIPAFVMVLTELPNILEGAPMSYIITGSTSDNGSTSDDGSDNGSTSDDGS